MPELKRVGAYAKLLANYAADDAIIEAGEAAELLFVRGLAFCATSDADGYITESQVYRYVGAGMRDAAKRAQRLVDVGVWERVTGGFIVRSWLKIHESSEQKGRRRKADRERKKPVIQTDSMRNPDGSQPDGVSDSLSLIQSSSPNGEQHDTTPHDTSTAQTTAQTIVAEWLERTRKRPPAQVVGQSAKLIDQMLAEGIDPDDVRRGLAAWMTKGLHPSSLPSVVNEVMNARPVTGRATQKAQGWMDVDHQAAIQGAAS